MTGKTWKEMLRPRSLKAKMVLFGLFVSFVPLAVYQLIILKKSADTLMNTYAQELQHKTELTALLIDQSIAHNVAGIRVLAKTLHLIENPEKQRVYLKEISDFRNDIADITLLDDQGFITASSSSAISRLGDAKHLPGPIHALFQNSRQSPAGDVQVSEAVNTPEGTHIYLLTKIAFHNQNRSAYLMIEMGLENMELLLTNFEDEVEGDKHAYLVDREGRIILSHDPGYPLFGHFLDMRAIDEMNQPWDPGRTTYIDSHNDAVIPSVIQISRFGANKALGWYLAAFVPTDQITRRVFSALQILIEIGILVIAASLVITYLMARNIVRPIRKMKAMTKKLRSGDYSGRIAIQKGAGDEITTLAHTLNSMAARIENHTNTLEKKNKFIHFILDASPVFTVTVKDSAVEYINKTFLNFIGFGNMQAFNDTGVSLWRHIYQIDQTIIRLESDEAILAMLTASTDQQIVYFKKSDGELSPPFVHAFACFKDVQKCIFTFTDVTRIESQKNKLRTKIQKAEEERQKQQQLMEIQARQAQMGEMIGSIAHQWKQPLNLLSISAFDIMESYKANELDDTYIQNYSQNLQNTVRFMSDTIDDFRNFFQPSTTMLPFSPAAAIESILKMLGKLYSLQNIDIRINAEKDVYVLGFENEFQQVIVNLLNNARDAFIERDIRERRIDISVKKEDKNVHVDIRDNAGGIPEELTDKIFDSYFSTKDPDKGSGIGLYMSKQIIEGKMSGTLLAANKNNGACFSIILAQAPL